MTSKHTQTEPYSTTRVIHTTIDGHSHFCYIVTQGEEGGRKVYDLQCGKWAYAEQVKIQKNED